MSRIGKKRIVIPKGVTIEQNDRRLRVAGPKGTLEMELQPQISVSIEVEDDKSFVVVIAKDELIDSPMWGTTRALIANMVRGVSDVWIKTLELNGVGFRMEIKGNTIVMRLGFSHPVEYKLPQGLTAKIDGNILSLSSIDKQLIGQVTAEIRAMKKPEPYKGKGFKYQDETIRRKSGKAAKGE